MIMTQREVVNRLTGRGFTQSHKHGTDTVYMWKRVRPWQQVLAQVGPDGTVNGEPFPDFITGANR